MLIGWKPLLIGQFICTAGIFAIACLVCYLWDLAMENDEIARMFDGSTSTFDLLNIVVGFSYVGVVNEFVSTLMARTALFARIKSKIINSPPSLDELEAVFNLDVPDKNVPEAWRALKNEIYVAESTESTMVFKLFGPHLALFIYFIVHPPLIRNEHFWDWTLVYSVSVSVLFAFLLNLWYIERFTLDVSLKKKSMEFARTYNMEPNTNMRVRTRTYARNGRIVYHRAV